jgi:hypothetical protein
MSYQRDFILRIIEEIAKFIAILLNLKQEKKSDQAYKIMARQSNRVVGKEYEDFLEMKFEDFKLSLKNKNVSSDYFDTLGRYFMTSGEVCLSLGKDKEAIQHLTFAKSCYEEAESEFKTYSFNRQVEMDNLKKLFIRVGLV